MSEYALLIRLVQLTLVSFIGFACIYFGYRLFSQIPVTFTNDGHVKMPNLGEMKLKVAPGIFFAIIGAVIIFISVNKSISISTGGDTPPQFRMTPSRDMQFP